MTAQDGSFSIDTVKTSVTKYAAHVDVSFSQALVPGDCDFIGSTCVFHYWELNLRSNWGHLTASLTYEGYQLVEIMKKVDL